MLFAGVFDFIEKQSSTAGAILNLAFAPADWILQLVAGMFTNFNGTSRNNLARLNPDGSLDASFDPGAGINASRMWHVAVQPDGKILVAGAFTNVLGLPRTNRDGTLDEVFDPGTGCEYRQDMWATIAAVTLQADGNILVGGQFTSVDGFGAEAVARLFGGDRVISAAPRLLAGSMASGQFQFQVSALRNQVVVVEASTDLLTPHWSPILTNKAATGPPRLTDSASPAHGRRFYRAVSP